MYNNVCHITMYVTIIILSPCPSNSNVTQLANNMKTQEHTSFLKFKSLLERACTADI